MTNIDVTGIDPWQLLAALYNASRVSPTTWCSAGADRAPNWPISAAQAKKEAQDGLRDGPEDDPDRYRYPRFNGGAPFWPDYLFGRPIKAFLVLKEDYLFLTKANLYDHDVGTGAAQKVINDLLASGQHRDLRHQAWKP